MKARDGRPIAAARVAVTDGERVVATARTDAEGSFRLGADAGVYAFTATAPGQTAAYRAPAPVSGTVPIELVVGGPGQVVSGRLDPAGVDRFDGVTLVVAGVSARTGDLFLADVDDTGRFEVAVPRSTGVELRLDDRAWASLVRWVRAGDTADVVVPVYRRADTDREPPDDAVAWVARAARREPAGGVGGPAWRALVAGAEIVGLGEATHGAHASFEINRRWIEALIRDHGVRVVGLEISWAEALRINDYVVDGRGDLRASLAGAHFWTADTEEMIGLLEWVRAWNAGRARVRRVRLMGVDVQFSDAVWAALAAYLARVDPDLAARVRTRLGVFAEERVFEGLDAGTAVAIRIELAQLGQLVDAGRDRFVRATSREEWEIAAHHIEVMAQIERYSSAGADAISNEARDLAMAENALWMARTYDGPAIVWAHNLHLTRRTTLGALRTGEVLAARLGARYVAVGHLIDRGSVRAYRQRADGKHELAANELEPPPGDYWERLFARGGLDVAGFDLRSWRTARELPAWLRIPHRDREVGTTIAATTRSYRVLQDDFDWVVFVRETSPSVPTPTGTRTPR